MNDAPADPPYSIADVAEKTGVSRRTVRYYVQRGLIDAPVGRGRGSGYTDNHVEQIIRVLRLQREGVTLDTMQQLPPEALGDVAAAPSTMTVPNLVLRLPILDGVQLELEASQGVPDAATLDELAAACRRILQKDSNNEGNVIGSL
jgi:DNA-binding transcriptional MerR regulator